MTDKIRLILAGMILTVSTALAPAVFAATDLNKEACSMATDAKQKEALGCEEERDLMPAFQQILNVAITVIGLAAVFIIVIGGLKYSTSAGDAGKATVAKNMIIWGTVGLVVSLLASAIVKFIVSAVT